MQSSRDVLLANESFLREILLSFFTYNFPLCIEKNSVKKLWKVLEMQLKMHTSVDPKFVFEKIKFKILHYIQHDLIRQHPRLSKDETSMFQSCY